MNNIKTLIWNYIICKYWRDYIQEEKDDIDIDSIMSDRAEAYAQNISDCYD
jgi:hypothetical protein